MGTKDGGAAVKAYETDDGAEQAFYGRGYVQLTWWSNYAAAGVAVGRGMGLLLDPELVKTPEVAYALMSHGMRTGEGFANGRRF
ncbi:glycoside hydrolase family 19 protein, partial [Klebsiella quasipneumoniae]|uniref:glycoside hydrolase family 19 protein n=2 Tax=Pseudomonadota TaxID=1224 RepID=UPI00272F3AA9